MIEARLESDALARLAQLEPLARKAIKNSLNAAILVGQAQIVQDTPVETARLRDSIDVTLATEDNLTASVHTNVEYAAFVEFGTGIYSEAPGAPRQPFTITAKNAKALHFQVDGEDIFRKAVTIQGMQPRAMFRSNIPLIEQVLQATLAEELPRALRGES